MTPRWCMTGVRSYLNRPRERHRGSQLGRGSRVDAVRVTFGSTHFDGRRCRGTRGELSLPPVQLPGALRSPRGQATWSAVSSCVAVYFRGRLAIWNKGCGAARMGGTPPMT
ncbi:uncharacterized protein LOC122246209 isoform X2 [Penaeus japonicus]|uniref:uncharacterized protein LOC122246209 isoform X2 n=1 Tax=Penaeus japonicus TaxID=27405 RepID=UPI001C716AC0|nr:uncharacterized protein LOC122246209 isoform X2 [Penaeus japonicus]